jgi:HEAT repeat protein
LDRRDDEDWLSRAAAVKALGDLGDTRAIEPIRRVVDWDKTDSIKMEGSNALHKLGVAEAAAP